MFVHRGRTFLVDFESSTNRCRRDEFMSREKGNGHVLAINDSCVSAARSTAREDERGPTRRRGAPYTGRRRPLWWRAPPSAATHGPVVRHTADGMATAHSGLKPVLGGQKCYS